MKRSEQRTTIYGIDPDLYIEFRAAVEKSGYKTWKIIEDSMIEFINKQKEEK